MNQNRSLLSWGCLYEAVGNTEFHCLTEQQSARPRAPDVIPYSLLRLCSGIAVATAT